MFGQLTFFVPFSLGDIQNCGSIVKVGPFILMLNLLKNDKVLSNLFGGMKYSFYFCISIFDKLINEINK